MLIDNNDVVRYVGSSDNIVSRLETHLIKSDNFCGAKSKTDSKIDKVYKCLIEQETETKIFKFKYIKIKNYIIKEAIEHIFIKYYQQKGKADWNSRR